MSTKTKLGVQNAKLAKNSTIDVEKKNMLLNAQLEFSDIESVSSCEDNDNDDESKINIVKKVNELKMFENVSELGHDKKWVKTVFNCIYMHDINLTNKKTVRITYDMVSKINIMTQNNIDAMHKNKNIGNVVYFYEISDNDNNKKYGWTENEIDVVATEQIFELNNRKGKDKINAFLYMFKKTLFDLKYKIVAICKYDTLCKDKLNDLNNMIIHGKSIKNGELPCVIKFYKEIIKKELETLKIKLIISEYNIYRIFSSVNNEQYIFGSYESIKNVKVNCICDAYGLIFSDTVKLEKMDTVNCTFECEGLLKVDEYIFKNSSIKYGFNKYYFVVREEYLDLGEAQVVQLEKEIFLIVQKDIMEKTFKDDNDYEKWNGYVAYIQNSIGIKYIFSSYRKSLKENLRLFYLSYDKNDILNVISNEQFDKLKICVLEKNIELSQMNSKYKYYCDRFYKNNIKVNNEIVETNDRKEKEKIKEIEKIKGINKNQLSDKNLVKFDKCYSESEKKLLATLLKDYGVNPNVRFKWSKSEITGKCYVYDFVLADYKIIIELDGPHHFRKIEEYDKTLEETINIDVIKMKHMIGKGFSIIRVPYVYLSNEEDIRQKISNIVKKYYKPTVIYLDVHNCYDLHKKCMTDVK